MTGRGGRLRPSYYTGVRLFSAFELALFTALVVVAVGRLGEEAKFVLGLSHGCGWILLCVLVFVGCLRGVFPWPLLAATVSPAGPVGSTIGFELLSRRRRRAPARQ